jgi:hypothetical protein
MIRCSTSLIFRQCLTIASALVQVPLALVKISTLLFYRRIFDYQPFRRLVWAVIALVACWGIIFFLLVVFQSNPVEASWGAKPGYLRFDSAKLGYAQVGSSIALDLLVLCLPLPRIYKLHLNRTKKLAVACIFWLGSL